MVGMTRAHMADPHIVRKIIEGREDDIRPCVGANYCLDRIYQGGAASASTTRPRGARRRMPHDDPGRARRKRIVIVGAGAGRARGGAGRGRARARGRRSSRRPTSRAARSGSPRKASAGAR